MICCIRAWAFVAACALLLPLATGGCALTNPDQLASNAVRSLMQADRIDFQGESHTEVDGFALPPQPAVEGRMTAGKQVALAYKSDSQANQEPQNAAEAPLLRWNLQPWLERYPQMKKEAAVDSKQSDGSTRAVRVRLDPEEVKKLVQSELLKQRDAMQQRVAAALQAPPPGLTAAQAAQRQSELQAVAAAQADGLDEMLRTLQADGEMTFWLDKAGNRPLRLSLGTNFRYRSGGQQRTETGQSVYTFGETGNDKLLPTP
jgi:hypothetical protein